MGYRRSGMDGMRFALPPLRPGVRNLLIVLGVLYVVELIVSNFVLPNSSMLYVWLAWSPSFAEPPWLTPWQPITKYLVQGPSPFGVLMTLMVVYFFLPWVLDRFVPKQVSQLAIAVMLGCLVAGLVWTGITYIAFSAGVPASAGWLGGMAMGWQPFVAGMVAAFALANPNGTINFMFVLPMKAMYLLYLDLLLVGLFFLASPSIATFEHFGAIGAVYLWFQLLGPGATRRRFKKKGKAIEKELKFRVYDGGRQGDQGDQDVWN